MIENNIMSQHNTTSCGLRQRLIVNINENFNLFIKQIYYKASED